MMRIFGTEAAQIPSAIKTQTQYGLQPLFKKTVAPFIGAILKICLYREAYLKGFLSTWIVLPIVKTIGNLWLRLQGLPAQFTTFDSKRLKQTERDLLKLGGVEEIEVGQNKSIKLAHFRAEKNPDSTCVLYLNGFGLLYQTAKKNIYKHNHADLDFAVLEWGDKASIESFAEDAEAAFNALLQKGYKENQIKVLAHCGPTYIATYLKLKHPKIDIVLVNPHTSFRDVVAKSNQLGLLGLDAILTEDYNLDNEEAFRKLAGSQGSTCLIIDPENAITPPDTVSRLKKALQNSKHHIIQIEEKFNKQFENPKVWEKYLNFLRPTNRYGKQILKSSEYGPIMKNRTLLFHGIHTALWKIPSIFQLGILSKQAADEKGLVLGFNHGIQTKFGVINGHNGNLFIGCARSPVHVDALGDAHGAFGLFIEQGISFVIRGANALNPNNLSDPAYHSGIPGEAFVGHTVPANSIVGVVVPKPLLSTKIKEMNFLAGGAPGTFHARCQSLLQFLQKKIDLDPDLIKECSTPIESKEALGKLEASLNALLLKYFEDEIDIEEASLEDLLNKLIPTELKIYDTKGIEIPRSHL